MPNDLTVKCKKYAVKQFASEIRRKHRTAALTRARKHATNIKGNVVRLASNNLLAVRLFSKTYARKNTVQTAKEFSIT